MNYLDCEKCGSESSIAWERVMVEALGERVPSIRPCQECGARVTEWRTDDGSIEPTRWLDGESAQSAERDYRAQRVSAELNEDTP